MHKLTRYKFSGRDMMVRPFYYTDFLAFGGSSVGAPGFAGGAISGGSLDVPPGSVPSRNHPGVMRVLTTTTPNSGYQLQSQSANIILGGGEEFNFVFYPLALTNTTGRIGFHTATTSTAPTDGVFISIIGTTLDGRTSNNSSNSTTGTSYTLSLNTWYRAKIKLNKDATLATFTLYSEAGAILWTDTLATNIPTTRSMRAGFAVTNSGSSAVDTIAFDYMSMEFGPLTRGGL